MPGDDNKRGKEIFHRKLKGDPVGHDAFGRPVMEGDFLVFAAGVDRSAQLRIIRIVETLEDKGYNRNKQGIKLRIERIQRGSFGSFGEWRVQPKTSTIQKLENTYLLDPVPQFILDIYEKGPEDE